MSQLQLQQTIKDNLRAKIQDTFVEMLPPEAWDKMISDVVDQIDVKKMVEDEARVHLSKSIIEEFNRPEWQTQFGNFGKIQAGKLMKRIVLENAAEIFTEIMSIPLSNTISNVQNNLRQQMDTFQFNTGQRY